MTYFSQIIGNKVINHNVIYLVVDQDRVNYNDSYHLSYFGAKLLANELLRAAPDMWPRSAEKSSAEIPLL